MRWRYRTMRAGSSSRNTLEGIAACSARLRELLRYLEYALPGAARDHGVALLATLLSAAYCAHDHDAWFEDLRVLGNQLQALAGLRPALGATRRAPYPVVRTHALLMQRRQFPWAPARPPLQNL